MSVCVTRHACRHACTSVCVTRVSMLTRDKNANFSYPFHLTCTTTRNPFDFFSKNFNTSCPRAYSIKRCKNIAEKSNPLRRVHQSHDESNRRICYNIKYDNANVLNKKLSCRRETARRFVSLNISLSHSRLFQMTLMSRVCVTPY